MEAFEKGVLFEEYLMRFKEIRDHFTKEEIQSLLKPENYLGMTDLLIDRVIGRS